MRAAAPMLALAGLAAVAVLAWRRPPLRVPTARRSFRRDELLRIIAREAQLVGVDPRVAAAFADQESHLNPDALGDANWPFKNDGENYRQHVLLNPGLQGNPWRHEPALWRSYGLFQLLAPFHVGPNEHPHILLDPIINTQRGVRAVRDALQKSAGDLYAARRRYVGCGPQSRCAADVITRIDAAWTPTLRTWGLA